MLPGRRCQDCSQYGLHLTTGWRAKVARVGIQAGGHAGRQAPVWGEAQGKLPGHQHQSDGKGQDEKENQPIAALALLLSRGHAWPPFRGKRTWKALPGQACSS